jgi:hypothetical protein
MPSRHDHPGILHWYATCFETLRSLLENAIEEENARLEAAQITPETWDNEAIRAIKAAAPIAEGDFNDTDLADTDRLLTACCMALRRDDDDRRPDPAEIKALLTGLQNGSGSWLDFVGAAILEADLPREERHLLYGAFCMACAFLCDIKGGDMRLGS